MSAVAENLLRNGCEFFPIVPLANRILHLPQGVDELLLLCVLRHVQNIPQLFHLQTIGMQVVLSQPSRLPEF